MVARRRVYPYAHTSHDKRITAPVNGHGDDLLESGEFRLQGIHSRL
jgi:hypothetical protein